MDNPLDNDDPKAADATPIAEDAPVAKNDGEPKWRDTAKVQKKRRAPRGLTAALAIAAVVAVAAGGITVWKLWPQSGGVAGSENAEAKAQGPLAPFVKGSIAKMTTFAAPRPIDDLAFLNRDKQPVKLSDFKGQVVVLNLWATWCAPCRHEMPTLANLQRHYDGKGVAVVALSGDVEDKFSDVVSFIDVQQPLEVYADPELLAKTSKLEVVGLPVTLILNKDGQMVARLDGDATWDTPEVKALLDQLLAES